MSLRFIGYSVSAGSITSNTDSIRDAKLVFRDGGSKDQWPQLNFFKANFDTLKQHALTCISSEHPTSLQCGLV